MSFICVKHLFALDNKIEREKVSTRGGNYANSFGFGDWITAVRCVCAPQCVAQRGREIYVTVMWILRDKEIESK